jgi:hypothetical protein
MKKNKGVATVLIIVAVLAVLAVGGVAYYLGKNSNIAVKNTPVNQNNVESTPVVNSNITSNKTTSETSDALNGKYTGYIKSISTENGKNSLVIDYVQMVSCEYDVTTDSCPDGYRIVNNNPLLRTFPISSNVKVTMDTNATAATSSLSALINILHQLNSGAKGDLCSIMLKNGVVTDITEVYLP